jgi:hypothetical protein
LEYRHTVNEKQSTKKQENPRFEFLDFPSNYNAIGQEKLCETSLKTKHLKKEGIACTKKIETKPTLLGQDVELCF